MSAPWEKFKETGSPWEKFKKPVKAEPSEPPVSLPSMQEVADASPAALQGFGQGFSLGHLPQLQAAAEPLITKIGDVVTGQDQSADLPDYAERRDAWIASQLATQKANPKAYLGGQLSGGLTSALAVPMGTLAKGASLGKTVAASMGAGAAIRALQNPGDVKGEVSPLQLEERVKDIGMMVPVPGTEMSVPAAAIDAAVPFIGPGLSKAGQTLRAGAERTAFKSLGPYAREAMKAFGRGKVNDIGGTMIDTGAVGKMSLPKSYETLAENLKNLKESAGQKLGDTVEMMAQKEGGSPIGVSRSKIGDELQSELINTEATDAAGVLDRNAKMQAHIEAFRNPGLPNGAAGPVEDSIPLLQAEMKKRAIGKEINWDRLPGADIPDTEAFNRALLTKLRGGVEEGGEALASKTGYPVDEFKSLKDQYGNLSEAAAIAEKRSQKNFANRFISPSDYGVGMVGAGLGAMSGGSPEERLKHAAMGASFGLANKAARLYGNQMATTALNKASIAAKYGGYGASALSQAPLAQGSLWNTLYSNQQKGK